MTSLSSFLRNQTGGTAVIAAIAVVPLALAVAGAVDMVRANRVQTVLQSAADAAAMAGATSKKTKKIDFHKIVINYIVANGGTKALSSSLKIDSKRDAANDLFTVTIEGKLEASLLSLIGINEFEIGAKSVVGLAARPLEVALVLDNTGSMAGSRIAALKEASLTLIDDLMVKPHGNADVKIGIVPFANYVNVGAAARLKNWMNVPASKTTTIRNVCTDTYPNATSSNCVTLSAVAHNDGIPYTYEYQQCDWDYGLPVQVCSDQTTTTKWNGCVGSRNSPLDTNIGNLNDRYPGIMDEYCPSELVPLTNSVPKVTTAINGMVATGLTYIPSGLLWGWNMLEPDEPIKGAYTNAKMKNLLGTKAIILMTDGANTMSPGYPNHVHDNSNVVANQITADLCNNIKADSIKIYTVSFEVSDPTTNAMLRACASSVEFAFVADNKEQLMASFAEIADGLTEIRFIE